MNTLEFQLNVVGYPHSDIVVVEANDLAEDSGRRDDLIAFTQIGDQVSMLFLPLLLGSYDHEPKDRA